MKKAKDLLACLALAGVVGLIGAASAHLGAGIGHAINRASCATTEAVQ